MRESGYYWVMRNGEWEIAEWALNSWWVIMDDRNFVDSNFEEIDERRITR